MDQQGTELTLHERQRLNRLIEQFQADFRDGGEPVIEDYLSRLPGLRRVFLEQLLLAEIELRRFLGEKPSTRDYFERFPNDHELIDSALNPQLANTIDQRTLSDSEIKDEEDVQPEQIGRYVVRRRVGRGEFGVVYFAYDPQLDRPVALKVPRRAQFDNFEKLAAFIEEARSAANLKHDGLVSVYDVQEHNGFPYIVQEYIEGVDLSQWAAERQPTHEQIAEVFAAIAEAIAYAHQQGLTHCDLKLANVVMDAAGRPHVTDFGVAVHPANQSSREGGQFGTPAVMAPEQVRGEGHRLDGRTDIWAIGVMLYELLTKHRPFVGSNRNDLFNQIQFHAPRPLRQWDPLIPRELERICLRCLSKLRADRYNSADELRDDLRTWLASTDSSPALHRLSADESRPLAKVVPKGLRSFDVHDADFFLDLLPGPRDRNGLPESIRFWKKRIETTEADRTFPVGLIYGPSGCGKSSLIKAGLLPVLSDSVAPIYIEASAGATESRIREQLHRWAPQLAADVPLPECFETLRLDGAAGGRKALLIIDQFEQWLHVHADLRACPLVDALRQCDGGKLQAIVVVRDDFYLRANRLFSELEIPLAEGKNQSVVDLFDPNHACNVLAQFGRAYDKLGEHPTVEEQRFIAEAVENLMENDKVICVRLALFAEMMKGRPWAPPSLKEVGGVSALDSAFLRETFCASTAPPLHRHHQRAARAVLKTLLPESGSEIRSCSRSREQLLEVSGYAKRPADFEELLRILDDDLRLITPTGSFESSDDPAEPPAAAPASGRAYQLTHDFVVRSLRTWLDLEDERTRSGRAAMRLRRRAANWQSSPENRQLPDFWEALSIELLTRRSMWTQPERRMMKKAWRYHSTRLGVLAIPLLLGCFIIAAVGATQTQVADLLDASPQAVPKAIEDLRPYRLVVTPILRRKALDPSRDPVSRLRAAYALAALGKPETDVVVAEASSAPEAEHENIHAALAADSEAARRLLTTRFDAIGFSPDDERTRAITALLALSLGGKSPAVEMTRLDASPSDRASFIEHVPARITWTPDLIDVLAGDAPKELRFALIAGLGRTAPSSLPAGSGERLRTLMKSAYQVADDAATHAAARFALQAWGEPLPAIESARTSSASAEWSRNSLNMTMVRLSPGMLRRADHAAGKTAAERTITIAPFLLSGCEVSRAAFLRFRDQEPLLGEWKNDDRVSPTDDHPVNSVSWEDAVLFLNWLSRQEGLRPYYEKHDGVWTVPNKNADSYRLPTEDEWEYACRCGSNCLYAFGDSVDLLSRYAVYGTEYRTAACGSRLPNNWGLFDMHGNVWEWCEDKYEPAQEESLAKHSTGSSVEMRVIRGGAFDNPSRNLQSGHRHGLHPQTRLVGIGFRVARTIPK